MNDSVTAIIAVLGADTTLMATATDVYQGIAPTSATYPFVTVTQAPQESFRTFGGKSPVEEFNILAVDHARSAKQAGTLAARVDAILDGARISITGHTQLGRLIQTTPLKLQDVRDGELYWYVGGRYKLIYT